MLTRIWLFFSWEYTSYVTLLNFFAISFFSLSVSFRLSTLHYAMTYQHWEKEISRMKQEPRPIFMHKKDFGTLLPQGTHYFTI